MKKALTTVFLIALTTVLSFAQTGRLWTLQECVDHALENNLTVQRSLLGVENSSIGVEQSKWSLAPSLNFGGSYGNSWGRTIDPTTNLFSTERFESTGVGFQAGMTIFQSNRLRNQLKRSRLDLEAAQYDLETSKDQVILSVITFYTSVIFNKELYENAKSQLNSTEQLLVRTEKQVEAGALPQSQLFDLIAQKANNEVQVVNAENTYNLSVLQLKQALQIPADQDFQIEVPEIELGELGMDNVTANQIYDIAITSMPNVKSADLGIESAALGVKVAKAQLYPSISASGNINTNYSSVRDDQRFVPDGTTNVIPVDPFQIGTVNNDPFQPVFSLPTTVEVPGGETFESYPLGEQWSDNVSRSVSLSLSVPIFNGLSARSNVQRSKIQQRQAEIQAEEVRNNLRQTIERAYNDVLAASRSYELSEKQVEAQEESFRVTQRSYELGAMNFIDFQVAQNNLFQARTNLLLAKYDYIFKQKVLDFYQGKPLEF